MSGESVAGAFDDQTFRMLAAFEDRSPWFRSRNRLIQWALRRYFPGASSLLEVGCGTGYVLRGLGDAFPALRLTGVEPGETGLAIARERVPRATLVSGDARELDYLAAFDVVSAFDVLEHIEDDGAVLRTLHAAVRPGGGLLVTVPQHRWLWSVADDRAGHVRRYARRDLVRRIEEAGFETVRATSFVAALLPALALFRLVRPGRRTVAYDVESEFRPRPLLDPLVGALLAIERWLVARGVSLPFGSSLLVVAWRR